MTKHLFIFGYETPEQVRNHEQGGQGGQGDEDSISFFIEADSETDADEWGKVVAQMFLNALYENEYQPPSITAYGNGIEKDPEARFDVSELSQLLILAHGDIEGLNEAVDSWLSDCAG